MFLNNSVHPLDAKNRVFVPKRFQDELGRTPEGVIVAYLSPGQDGCLNLFPESTFHKVLEQMQTRPFAGADQRAAKRVFFANTVRVELDSSGRLLIPEKLRSRVGLGKEVVMVGVDDRAEIWAKAAWEKYELEHESKLDELDSVIPGPDSSSADR